jgi:UDP-N-acetylmuramoyl-L-alanyl-D-glutamate--2,6-diaminopimelate ligase
MMIKWCGDVPKYYCNETNVRLKIYADFRAQIFKSQLSGLLKIDGNEVWVKLIGTFNAYNLLAIYGTAIELGMDSLEALHYLS